MTGESYKDGKQKQRRALDNGCLACLFIEIKAGDFSSELQTGVFPLHQRQPDTPGTPDNKREKTRASPTTNSEETKKCCFFSPVSSHSFISPFVSFVFGG